MYQRITRFSIKTRQYELLNDGLSFNDLVQHIGKIENRYCPKHFGELLSIMRKDADMTLETLSAKTGVSPALLDHYERGRAIPPRDFIVNFSKAVNSEDVPLRDLLDRWSVAKIPFDGTAGSLIKQARKRRGLYSRDAAKRIGISPATLGRFERNEEVPKTSVLMQIASVLKSERLMQFAKEEDARLYNGK